MFSVKYCFLQIYNIALFLPHFLELNKNSHRAHILATLQNSIGSTQDIFAIDVHYIAKSIHSPIKVI